MPRQRSVSGRPTISPPTPTGGSTPQRPPQPSLPQLQISVTAPPPQLSRPAMKTPVPTPHANPFFTQPSQTNQANQAQRSGIRTARHPTGCLSGCFRPRAESGRREIGEYMSRTQLECPTVAVGAGLRSLCNYCSFEWVRPLRSTKT